MTTITIDEAINNLKAMFPNMAEESIIIALKANSKITYNIGNNLQTTIDFLLSHEAEKAITLETEVTSEMSKTGTKKPDSDLLMAIELQKEEMETMSAMKVPQIESSPNNIPMMQEEVVEGEEYIIAHKNPVGTFVCMYPELINKEDMPKGVFQDDIELNLNDS